MWKCPSVGHLECRRRRLRDDEDEQLASSSALAPAGLDVNLTRRRVDARNPHHAWEVSGQMTRYGPKDEVSDEVMTPISAVGHGLRRDKLACLLPPSDPPLHSIGAVQRMPGIAAATVRNWEEP
jgi:hypothetical protein